MNESLPRLAALPVGAKVMLTAFLALLGTGYLVALGNIYYQHNEADLKPGMTLDDLRRAYHGLEVSQTTEHRERIPSEMEERVSPGGDMRRFLEKGGPAAVDTLMGWLEDGSPEAQFAEAAYVPGGPTPQQVITDQCVLCHNPEGDMYDVPYAESEDEPAQFQLVVARASPDFGPTQTETTTRTLAPPSVAELMHITHAHILSMPIFTLCVGVLFFLSGLPKWLTYTIGPIPMLALCGDIAGWWLARPYEPAIFLIAVAGAVFGASYGFQILATFGALWFGRRSA